MMTSCYRVVIVVGDIPSNTPKGEPVFITGNFNNWDPGDGKYILSLMPDSSYSVTLPRSFGTIEYKFTRGDWRTVEKDICGYEIPNRRLKLGDADTITAVVSCWGDLQPINCPRVTLEIKSLPENTPANAQIAVAGSFNSWIPGPGSFFQKDNDGRYLVTLDKQEGVNEIEFLITRGYMSTCETDIFGNDIPVRKVRYGEKDTIEITVRNWKDIGKNPSNVLTFIIRQIPGNTPPGSDIYMVSNLNNWELRDKNFRMMKYGNGMYSISIPKTKKTMDYKFTRGDWSTVEVDGYGYEILNRQTELDRQDTVFVTIDNWKDLSQETRDKVTIILKKIPDITPSDARIYVAGNFNSWRTDNPSYELKRDSKGQYIIRIPREWGSLEFKITRGSWSQVEIDRFGNEIPNRQHLYKDIDTLVLTIENWKDLNASQIKGVTMVLKSLPDNTPKEEGIFLASDINNWEPGDPDYKFRRDEKGRYVLTIHKTGGSMEYKITRGSWRTVEVNENGTEKPNRVLNFGFSDTNYVDVVKWRDLGGKY
jgi:hypothetical protein